MMGALVKQPVSVGIEADQRAFQLYSSGVFTEDCGTTIDHAVLLVVMVMMTNQILIIGS
jgi:KDEL-tailed cysteine endopeptidase